jgi:hypothetical protein
VAQGGNAGPWSAKTCLLLYATETFIIILQLWYQRLLSRLLIQW